MDASRPVVLGSILSGVMHLSCSFSEICLQINDPYFIAPFLLFIQQNAKRPILYNSHGTDVLGPTDVL